MRDLRCFVNLTGGPNWWPENESRKTHTCLRRAWRPWQLPGTIAQQSVQAVIDTGCSKERSQHEKGVLDVAHSNRCPGGSGAQARGRILRRHQLLQRHDCACPAGETCNFDACTGASCRLDCSANFHLHEAAGRAGTSTAAARAARSLSEKARTSPAQGSACAPSPAMARAPSLTSVARPASRARPAPRASPAGSEPVAKSTRTLRSLLLPTPRQDRVGRDDRVDGLA